MGQMNMQEFYYYIGFILYILLCVATLAFSVFFFRKMRQNTRRLNKFDGYHFLIFTFFLLIFASFIIRIYFMFFYPQGDMAVFVEAFLDPNFRLSHLDYEKLVAIHVMLEFMGFGTIALAIEHYIYKKTRKLLAVLIYATSPLLVVLPYNLVIILQYIPIFITIVSIFIMIGFYANLARKSSGVIRRKAAYIAIGFLLFFGGILINSQSIMMLMFNYTLNFVWIVPIWFMMALLVLFYGYQKQEPEKE